MDLPLSAAVRSCERTSLGIAVDLVKRRRSRRRRFRREQRRFRCNRCRQAANDRGDLAPRDCDRLARAQWPHGSARLRRERRLPARVARAVRHHGFGVREVRCWGIREPRVAVLSVGEERSEGKPACVFEAARLLEAAPVRFIGNVEGRELFHNVADVIVTDGFVGNIVLKTGEGMIADFGRVMRDALLGGNLLTKVGTAMLAPALATAAQEVRLRNLRWRAAAGFARKLHRDARTLEPQRDQTRDRGGRRKRSSTTSSARSRELTAPHLAPRA